jgi:YHS domain-containing protein
VLLVTFVPLGIDGECNPDKEVVRYLICFSSFVNIYISVVLLLMIWHKKDPVCNMMVDEKKAQHVSEANGQKIYLCFAQCKSQFDQNPNKYGY